MDAAPGISPLCIGGVLLGNFAWPVVNSSVACGAYLARAVYRAVVRFPGGAVHMTDVFVRYGARAIGMCIEAGVVFFMGLPLLIALLLAFKLVRYREWLAMVAVVMSMAILADSGNYLYNLVYWTSSRFSPEMNIVSCVLIFASPLFLFAVVLICSRRRLAWGVGMLVVAALALASVRNQYRERKAGDAEAYRQGVKPLSARTGTPFVRWWRDNRNPAPKVLLQGHVLEGTAVVLLTDPFSRSSQSQFCTGSASTYSPPVRDPAVLGNVTEVVNLKSCPDRWMQGLAIVERPVATYRAIPFQPFSGAPDPEVLSHPIVRRQIEKLGYDPANFDPGNAELSQATGRRQISIFITALQPIRRAPNAFPCSGPVLLISTHDLGNVQAVLPYCTLNWNLFAVDDDLYVAAVTQQPTPPGEEVMNPEQTYWLLHFEGTELKQLWPTT